MMRLPIIYAVFFLLFTGNALIAQDSTYLKVHFLYGSKPAKKYRHLEKKWFGGIHGGHVGVEIDTNMVFHFRRKGKFHVIARQGNKHSRFSYEPTKLFWQIFDSRVDSLQKLTVVVPVSNSQKQALDSLRRVYVEQTPYDYAFLGMRCGAATYDVLSYIGFFKQRHHRVLRFYVFRPKALRKKMIKMAQKNHWETTRQKGTSQRVWEQD